MNQMEADEQLGGAPGQLGDLVQIPDLVVEGAGAHGQCSQWNGSP